MTRPEERPGTSRSALTLLAVVVIIGFAWIGTSCNGGQRPTLVEPGPATPQPELDLEVPPAPDSVAPLPPASSELDLEASVGDALLAWAAERAVPYLDACTLVTPAPGELCDSPTDRDTVRLLGPNGSQTWYIVTVDEVAQP